MYLEWTNHLASEKDKENFKQSVYNARPVLDRLWDILDKKEKGLDRTEMSLSAYSEPCWDVRQAHKNGIRQDLTETKALIDLDRNIIVS